jgi:hypothetical protein
MIEVGILDTGSTDLASKAAKRGIRVIDGSPAAVLRSGEAAPPAVPE